MDWGGLKRWLYRGDRPHFTASVLNRFWAAVHGRALAPAGWVTLTVRGRRTGRAISFPIVMAAIDGERYVVSMLGAEAAWVANVRAAGGDAIVRRGREEAVRLEEVPVERRAPILKEYLQRAPGARPHVPVDKAAPLEAFEAIAAEFPVFRVRPRDP